MGIKRKKQPITKTSSAVDKRPSLGKSSIATQSTISKYHTLLKRQTQLRKDLRRGFDEKIETDLAAIQKELDDLGGIQGYQQASKLGQDGQRGGDTSKIMVGWLLELQLKPTDGTKMKMLEIGALSPCNYAATQSWIDNSPIDLNSQHPAIQQQDFLQKPVPSAPEEQYDIVSCSLVLNFVPDITDRGKMLRLIYEHLKDGGHMFLVLPRPCLENSRYLDNGHLQRIMRHVGFREIQKKDREGAKVVYSLWQKTSPKLDQNPTELATKRILKTGGKRNNFCICLKQDESQ